MLAKRAAAFQNMPFHSWPLHNGPLQGTLFQDTPSRMHEGRGQCRGLRRLSREADQPLTRFTMASPKLSVLPLPPRSGVTLSRSLVMVSRMAWRRRLPFSTMPR